MGIIEKIESLDVGAQITLLAVCAVLVILFAMFIESISSFLLLVFAGITTYITVENYRRNRPVAV